MATASVDREETAMRPSAKSFPLLLTLFAGTIAFPDLVAAITDYDEGWDLSPQVTTDGAGNWVATWTSNDSLRLTIGYDDDILIARSTDNGATWTAPAPLNTDAAADTRTDYDPQITTDKAGKWVAIWPATETPGSNTDILVARSTDNGATWTAPAPLDPVTAGDFRADYDAQIASDNAGHWVAIWFSASGSLFGGFGDVLVARSIDRGATWTAPASLSTNTAAHGPQVTTDGSGNWVATWGSPNDLGGTIGPDSDVLVARSTDNGATWTVPAPLNANAATDFEFDGEPQITTDGAGHWMAAWTSTSSLSGTIGTDPDILVARSTDNGATWTAPAPLNSNAADDAGADHNAQVTTDGTGSWVATWRSYDTLTGTIGNDADILVARSNDNGATWTAPEALNTNAGTDSGDDHAPEVTTDDTGDWVATWHSFDTLDGTIGTDADILVARSSNNGATWSTPAPLNTNAAAFVCTESPVDSGACLIAPNTKLRISDSHNPIRDKVLWQWSRGDAFDQLYLGTPNVYTSYLLCVYDTSASVPSLVTSIELWHSGAWNSMDPGGFDYDTNFGASYGKTKLRLRTGAASETKVKLSADGYQLSLPGPFSEAYFEQSPSVIAQLISSDDGCWTSEFGAADNKRSDVTRFNSQTK
jgi:hypothetical protein